MSRIVQRHSAIQAAREQAGSIPRLIRTDSIEPGILLSPISSPTIFSGCINDDVEMELKICCNPMLTSPIIGGYAVEAEASEEWMMNLPFPCSESFEPCTPIRTFKDTQQSFQCRYMSASVPSNVDKCTLSAS